MKVWTITLAFNDPQIIKQSLDAYYRTKHPEVETVHILLDAHWPIKYSKFRADLELIAREHRCILVDPGRNMGLHENFNWAWRQFNIPDNAGVIGYDPDCTPLTQGWDMAFCKVFTGDPTVGWLSLMNPRAKPEIFNNKLKAKKKVNGVEVATVKYATVNSICMFRQSWLRAEGGLMENRPLYGGLEEVMQPRLEKAGLEWAFLTDYHEDDRLRNQENEHYRAWKWHTAHTKEIPADKQFETWLRETGKI